MKHSKFETRNNGKDLKKIKEVNSLEKGDDICTYLSNKGITSVCLHNYQNVVLIYVSKSECDKASNLLKQFELDCKLCQKRMSMICSHRHRK